MDAIVNSVFVRDPSEPVEFGLTKEEAPVLDNYRFNLRQNVQANISMSLDPQDGNKYTLIIGCFIDGVECPYVTDWLSNQDPIRAKDYAFEMLRYSRFSTPRKFHTVQIKLGQRKLLQYFRSREYDLYESEVYYYRVAPPVQGGG